MDEGSIPFTRSRKEGHPYFQTEYGATLSKNMGVLLCVLC